MKTRYLIAISITFSLGLLAQNKNTKDADKLFDKFEYLNAADAYKKLVQSGKADGYVYKKLGDSYYQIFNSKEATMWYEKAVQSKQDAETYYRYAQMLKAEGKTEQANAQLKKFSELAPNDKRAKALTNNPSYIDQIKSQGKLYSIKKADFSSEQTEFGAVLTNQNEIYFASARNTSRQKSKMNDEPYLDIYKAIYNNGTVSQPTLVEELNTKWHDGTATVSADGNTMYYATESFNDNKSEKVKSKNLKYSQIFIYKAVKDKDGKWTNSKPVNLNSTEYSLRNPSLSKDGKTLYYSSDMKGGLGGEDIWKSTINTDGSLSKPENLGEAINTEGNEGFPFIDETNTLFFASNGRPGFGGYDVFMKDLNKNEETKNVGEPVNSNKDDFSFTYNTSKKIGFFASNRLGTDDIFMADPVCNVEAIVMVKDKKTGLPIQGAMANMLDSKQKSIGTKETDDNGNTKFTTKCDEEHSIQVSKSGYENAVVNLSKQGNGKVILEASLEPIQPIITEKEVILQPIYFEYDKWNITPEGAYELDKLVQVMNEYPNMVIFAKSHTDNRGNDDYNMKLSERRAQSTVQYIVSKGIAKERISGKGSGETEPKAPCQECTEEEHAQNRRSEFLIVKK